MAKLKDNVADCKLRSHHWNNKHHIKQMVLIEKAILNSLITANASPSPAIKIKYPTLNHPEGD
jgi:hypothetical protein